MVTLRFSSSLPRPPRPPRGRGANGGSSPLLRCAIAVATVGIGAGLAISALDSSTKQALSSFYSRSSTLSPCWASLSLTDGPTGGGTTVEPKTGAAFPAILHGGRRLLGIGLRKTNILGLKSIDVYAFGVYADSSDIKNLSGKYASVPDAEIGQDKGLISDVLDQDFPLTVRLQIVYSRLSIGSVRSAFEKSVGSRIQKFSGSDNKELLQSFTSLFKNELKLPKGSSIELSREEGYVLQTTINGEVLGKIQSKLLCQSVLDLYLGEEPFDKRAKEDIQLSLASILHERSD